MARLGAKIFAIFRQKLYNVRRTWPDKLPAGLLDPKAVWLGEKDRVSRKFLTLNHTTKGHQNHDKNSFRAASGRSRTERR